MKRHLSLLASVLLVIVMVFAFASCDVIEQYIPEIPGLTHKHDFVDGKCECGEADPDYVAPHEHNFVEGKCECGEVDPSYSCVDHVWSEPVLEKDATCTEEGRHIITCTVCGYERYTPILPYGHEEETIPGYAATCTATGLTDGKKCTVCGETTVEQEEIPASHTEAEIPGVAPTCTATGLTVGVKCSVCDEILTAQVEIPMTGHNYVDGKCECGLYSSDYTGDKVFVIEANNFAAITQGAKADGESEVLDVNGFYTIFYSAKFKLDGSKKNFVDGFAGTQRFNWGGGTVIGETTKNALKIVVDGTATVKIWWVCGGTYKITDAEGNEVEVPRQVGIYNEDGTLYAQTNVTRADGTPDKENDTDDVKNDLFISELTISEAGTYYIGNVGNTNYFFKVETTVTAAPAAPATSGVIDVATTDTYCIWCDADIYTFTAGVSGTYTFSVPAGLGVHSQKQYDAWRDPEVDFQMSPNGGTFSVDLAEGEAFVFHVAAATKDSWTINWSVEEGEVNPDNPGTDTPVENDTTLELGDNTIIVPNGAFGQSLDCTFVADKDGVYVFSNSNMMISIIVDENTSYNGKANLTAGTYRVVITYYTTQGGAQTVTVSYEDPTAEIEPDGSSEAPFVWETLPESVTFDSNTLDFVYYVFTANFDGSVTFNWATEDSYFIFYELDAEGNNTSNSDSGYLKLSHSFVVETGKTYKVGLCTWNVSGETVVTIAASACNHVWSEATCETPSTCANCGATTGDLADHTSTVANPTCSNPDVCGVCGTELGYIPHSYGEPEIITNPDCATNTNGSQKLTCTVCGHVEEETIWVYHTLEETVVDATCTENGSYHAVCTVCGYEESNVIEAQGHYNWYATCGETTTCMECGTEFTVEHSGSPATCTDPMYCYNCWQYVGEALGHSYTGGVCTVCDAVDTESLVSIPDVIASADGTKVLVAGYVKSIDSAWDSYWGNMNVTIRDEDGNTLYLYRLATEVKLGDYIVVDGAVGSYNGAKQIAQGATAVIVVSHDECTEFTVATCVSASCCVICGVVNSPALGHSYENGSCTVCGEAEPTTPVVKYYLQATIGGTVYYWNGAAASGKGTLTTDKSAAVELYMDTVDGGVNVYFVDASGAKNYLYFTDGNTGFKLSTSAEVIKYDATNGYLYQDSFTTARYVATYGTQDIRTYKASNIPGSSNNAYMVMTVVE